MFEFTSARTLGTVQTVDTASVVVEVSNIEQLKRLQVNRLVALQSSRAGESLIGVVQKIARSLDPKAPVTEEMAGEVPFDVDVSINLVRIALIGTLIGRVGEHRNVFRRTLETVPDIGAACVSVEGKDLSEFMSAVANVTEGEALYLGVYTLDDQANAYLNANKLLQRHALIVGSTGSGKSYTTARILEEMAKLSSPNAIVFDVHGEYGSLDGSAFDHLKIAGPSDIGSGRSIGHGVIHLPFWLLGYEAMVAMLTDRSDSNAPNQAMALTQAVLKLKQEYLCANNQAKLATEITVDSPIPFKTDDLLSELERLNEERVPGARATVDKAGPLNDRLTRMLGRMSARISDRRLGFLFSPPKDALDLVWLDGLVSLLMVDAATERPGIKVIDFSEVPSDVLPLMVSLVANVVFTVQQWREVEKRYPLALVCDEAHLYIPATLDAAGSDQISVRAFERIAKEGRKYGIALLVISQRPSEVNRTVLSQCNNIIAMRLSNAEDQAVVRRSLPDSLGTFADLLPVLDTGEAIVIGDATLLPTRIRVAQPSKKPTGDTIAFWTRWNSAPIAEDLSVAVTAWRRQSQSAS
jgi:hypothetical protein